METMVLVSGWLAALGQCFHIGDVNKSENNGAVSLLSGIRDNGVRSLLLNRKASNGAGSLPSSNADNGAASRRRKHHTTSPPCMGASVLQ